MQVALRVLLHITQQTSSAATIDGYERVPSNDEASLKKAVASQPVAVAINGFPIQFYHSVSLTDPILS